MFQIQNCNGFIANFMQSLANWHFTLYNYRFITFISEVVKQYWRSEMAYGKCETEWKKFPSKLVVYIKDY